MDSELREALITHAGKVANAHITDRPFVFDGVQTLKMVCKCGAVIDHSGRHRTEKVVDALLAYTIPCPTCEGRGGFWTASTNTTMPGPSPMPAASRVDCPACSGSGRVPALTETR